jgi:hypothetical protein
MGSHFVPRPPLVASSQSQVAPVAQQSQVTGSAAYTAANVESIIAVASDCASRHS